MIFFRKSQDDFDGPDTKLDALRTAAEKANLPHHVHRVVLRELELLESLDPSAAEYGLGVNYLDYLVSLPWSHFTEDDLRLDHVQEVLEAGHYGLQPVKERILEYLAVRTLCSLQQFQILVVDDEPIARTNLEYILRKEGYGVDTAANGEEALHRIRACHYDLILTDLKMEKMDGLQLLEHARIEAPHTETVIITGYATVNSAVESLKKGAVHYLSKPVQLDELRALVHSIKEKKRHMQMARGPVLCFSGPPGTGKTSIGRSIAKALGRRFTHISLAGLRDEAELRGHRRTYVGAMPGRIIQEFRRLGVRNPVIMLDEIDKIGRDFRGDATSVLLEILDPVQNTLFVDYYLDVPFDLSATMFIATANVVERLPGPLQDRMEVIEFSGYTEKEKLQIAQRHLIPKQLRENALEGRKVHFTDEAVRTVVRDYTREPGLRQLEREIASVCRKLARAYVQGTRIPGELGSIDATAVRELLGPPRYLPTVTATEPRVGVTTGLVWSESGGEIIFVEATRMQGAGQLIPTGSLGTILKESARTALSFVRSHAEDLGIDPKFFKDTDIHIHIPAGAIPKDGPSAGATICLALVSLLTRRPARNNVGISAEITLGGRLLPVSGVREKLLAAQRAGLQIVILPHVNRADVESLPTDVSEGLKILTCTEILDAVPHVLAPEPVPAPQDPKPSCPF